MIPITKYGVHITDGIPYLVQGYGDIQNPYNLIDNPKFKLRIRTSCPHNINLFPKEPPNFMEFVQGLPKNDSLITLLTPKLNISKGEQACIRNKKNLDDILFNMSNMYTTTESKIILKYHPMQYVLKAVCLTNITPLVIDVVDCPAEKIYELISLTNNFHRNILLVLDEHQPKPRGLKEIKTKVTKIYEGEYWRTLGAVLLRESLL